MLKNSNILLCLCLVVSPALLNADGEQLVEMIEMNAYMKSNIDVECSTKKEMNQPLLTCFKYRVPMKKKYYKSSHLCGFGGCLTGSEAIAFYEYMEIKRHGADVFDVKQFGENNFIIDFYNGKPAELFHFDVTTSSYF